MLPLLARLRDTVNSIEGGSYSTEEAQAILSEVLNIENMLRAGRKEKQQLHLSLKMLGEDLLGEDIKALGQQQQEQGGSSGTTGGSRATVQRHSIASQTDFAAEVSRWDS